MKTIPFKLIAGVLVAALLAGSGLAWLIAGDGAASRLHSSLLERWQHLNGRASATLGLVTVRLDPHAPGHRISPLIYGVSAADPDTVRALGATLDRWGGNPSSRYNWVNGHAWNAGRDWQFRNVNYSGQPGSAADSNVSGVLAVEATPLLTVPTLGFVARDDNNENRSQSVPAEGGPPLKRGSQAIQGYDPAPNQAATSLPSFARTPASTLNAPSPAAPAVYQDQWVSHLVTRFGVGGGGVRYYAMDNEPDLWSTTHTDVHPARMGYDDVLANFESYATMVKEQDPRALVLGPDVSGWASYFYSDLDRGADNFATHADRKAHGDQPFLPWWLSQVSQADNARGSRSLDLLDVHYYPQGQGVYSDAKDAATQARRIRSVRSLYDPSYQDESWIGDRVMLIPRLKQWISDAYPGTGLAITEYNWGGQNDASGAVALAEALGVFGREGVELASYWTYPPPDSPAGAAFRLFRNFDGHGAAFGDRSLPITSSDPRVAAFAAGHSNSGEIDVLVANESLTESSSVALAQVGSSYRATQFRLAAGSSRIVPAPMAADEVVSLPPLSLSLVRLMPN
jgi:hypothetical protein